MWAQPRSTSRWSCSGSGKLWQLQVHKNFQESPGNMTLALTTWNVFGKRKYFYFISCYLSKWRNKDNILDSRIKNICIPLFFPQLNIRRICLHCRQLRIEEEKHRCIETVSLIFHCRAFKHYINLYDYMCCFIFNIILYIIVSKNE